MRSARELLPAVTVPLTNWSFRDRYLTCYSSVTSTESRRLQLHRIRRQRRPVRVQRCRALLRRCSKYGHGRAVDDQKMRFGSALSEGFLDSTSGHAVPEKRSSDAAA